MLLKLFKESIKRRSLGRCLTNLKLEEKNLILSGRILDLGGRDLYWQDSQPRGASYLRFMKFENNKTEFLRLDIDKSTNPEYRIDFEKDSLPFADSSVDNVLAFNLLEHIFNHQFLISEMFRVLKPNGLVVGSAPFLIKIHPDPYDFFRYSKQGLEKLFQEAGFREVKVEFIGRGPFCAEYSQIEFLIPGIFRPLFVGLALALDKLFLKLKPNFKEKYPLAYLFILKK